ncbi:MAG: hypothetical protein Q4G26_11170 [Paracoccus sp. (in: a-proteobacteria)]|nr:hypothetical protein [Paracoccus sp. (in: a-proteobacteria)]
MRRDEISRQLKDAGWDVRLSPKQPLSVMQTTENRFGFFDKGCGFSFIRFEDEIIDATRNGHLHRIFGMSPFGLLSLLDSGEIIAMEDDEGPPPLILHAGTSLDQFFSSWVMFRAAVFLGQSAGLGSFDQERAIRFLKDNADPIFFRQEEDNFWNRMVFMLEEGDVPLGRDIREYIETGRLAGFFAAYDAPER